MERYKIGFRTHGDCKWQYVTQTLTKAELLELLADMLCYADKVSITQLPDISRGCDN